MTGVPGFLESLTGLIYRNGQGRGLGWKMIAPGGPFRDSGGRRAKQSEDRSGMS